MDMATRKPSVAFRSFPKSRDFMIDLPWLLSPERGYPLRITGAPNGVTEVLFGATRLGAVDTDKT
jgi:hypothetical protein